MGWHQINIYDTERKVQLMQDVSGFVIKGGLTGIVGPSSSGKTLLMKALCGRAEQTIVSGDISLRGRAHDPVKDRGEVTFEDDLLVGVLTLQESLEISMMLRRDISQTECKKKVADMIKALELSHVAGSVIGTVLKRGLSGGQKRRTSVGVELVASSGTAVHAAL